MAHVVVAGGGIAGLAAAVGLARAGQRVTVAERRAVLDETGAGLQLSPNATRCLEAFGLLDALLPHATEPEAVRIRRADDASLVSLLPLGAAARVRFGFPFLVLHRADLQGVLVAAAEASPDVALRRGTRVERVLEEGLSLKVELVDPVGHHEIQADAFVAADGVHGTNGNVRRHRAARGRLAWRALVPAAAVSAGFRRAESNLWLGTRAHMVHYPLRGGTLVNVVVITEGDVAVADGLDRWAQPGDPDRLRNHLAGWHAEPRGLVDAAPSWRIWPLHDDNPHVAWSAGRRTVAGDAAHPMLPFLAQGASQAIEDAVALSTAVARHPGAIPEAFAAYEASRRPRAGRVQAVSRRQGRIYHLGGPMGRARDLAMRLLGPTHVLDSLQWLYGAECPAP